MKGRVAACTIVSRNYAAYATTLEDSIRHTNLEIDFHVLVADVRDEAFAQRLNFANLVWFDDLNIPNFRAIAFKFAILELNTDVKPFMRQSLADEHDYFYYLDPDTQVYGSPETLTQRLAGNTAIITPYSVAAGAPHRQTGGRRSGCRTSGRRSAVFVEDAARSLATPPNGPAFPIAN